MIAPTARVYHKIPDQWEPIIYSKKIDEVVHDNVVFNQIFNRDYEGELKGVGSKLVIRSWPELKANDYVLGTPINPQRVDARSKEVVVGRAWELSIVLDQWDLMWSDMKAWEGQRSKKIGVATSEFLENKWFGEAYAAAANTPFTNWNTGNNAGINGDIKLGTAADPVILTAEKSPTQTVGTEKNVLKHIYDMDMVHTRHQGASSATRKYMITSPEVLKVLREFDAFERTSCNETLDVLLRKDVMSYGRNAATGFEMYLSNRLGGTAGTGKYDGKTIYPIFFGDTRAWTYADLVSETGIKDSPDTPGVSYEYHIGAYDWFLAQPEYFGVSYVAV